MPSAEPDQPGGSSTPTTTAGEAAPSAFARYENALEALRDGQTYESAAGASGMCLRTLELHRRENPQLDAACMEARLAGKQLIAGRIARSMYAGAEKVCDDPRYTGAACFALTNLAPDEFRNTQDIRVRGGLAVGITDLTHEEAERLSDATDDDRRDEAEETPGPVSAGG